MLLKILLAICLHIAYYHFRPVSNHELDSRLKITDRVHTFTAYNDRDTVEKITTELFEYAHSRDVIKLYKWETVQENALTVTLYAVRVASAPLYYIFPPLYLPFWMLVAAYHKKYENTNVLIHAKLMELIEKNSLLDTRMRPQIRACASPYHVEGR